MQTEVIEHFIARQDWLETVSDSVQRTVVQALNSVPGSQVIRDVLHGTWLGHPLHPVLTDVPTGAWTATMVLDLASLASRHDRWERGADASLSLGLAGAVGSALTGLADWSNTYGQERKVGLVHALLNGTATLCYAGSLARRLSGRREGAVTLSALGYLCMLAGAFLGGELVFRLGTSVNRNAWTEGPSDFIPAMRQADLAENKPTKVDVDGVDVLLVRQGGEIYALEHTCAHAGGPLAEGQLQDGVIICPWHGSNFRLADGGVVHGPATAPQPCYQIRVREGMIEVRRAPA